MADEKSRNRRIPGTTDKQWIDVTVTDAGRALIGALDAAQARIAGLERELEHCGNVNAARHGDIHDLSGRNAEIETRLRERHTTRAGSK